MNGNGIRSLVAALLCCPAATWVGVSLDLHLSLWSVCECMGVDVSVGELMGVDGSWWDFMDLGRDGSATAALNGLSLLLLVHVLASRRKPLLI